MDPILGEFNPDRALIARFFKANLILSSYVCMYICVCACARVCGMYVRMYACMYVIF
jgi:hypothetical protein